MYISVSIVSVTVSWDTNVIITYQFYVRLQYVFISSLHQPHAQHQPYRVRPANAKWDQACPELVLRPGNCFFCVLENLTAVQRLGGGGGSVKNFPVGDHVVLSPGGVILVTSPETESSYPRPLPIVETLLRSSGILPFSTAEQSFEVDVQVKTKRHLPKESKEDTTGPESAMDNTST